MLDDYFKNVQTWLLNLDFNGKLKSQFGCFWIHKTSLKLTLPNQVLFQLNLTSCIMQCHSDQNFDMGQDLEKKMKSATFFQYMLPNSLSLIHNPFETVSVKIQPKLNYSAGYLINLILYYEYKFYSYFHR